MIVEFNCNKCSRLIRVKREMIGMRGQCPQCGAPITVPDPDQWEYKLYAPEKKEPETPYWGRQKDEYRETVLKGFFTISKTCFIISGLGLLLFLAVQFNLLPIKKPEKITTHLSVILGVLSAILLLKMIGIYLSTVVDNKLMMLFTWPLRLIGILSLAVSLPIVYSVAFPSSEINLTRYISAFVYLELGLTILLFFYHLLLTKHFEKYGPTIHLAVWHVAFICSFFYINQQVQSIEFIGSEAYFATIKKSLVIIAAVSAWAGVVYRIICMTLQGYIVKFPHVKKNAVIKNELGEELVIA